VKAYLGALFIVVLGACSAPPGQPTPSSSAGVFAFGDASAAAELPAAPPGDPDDMRPGANGGVIFPPTSVRLEHGVPYRFNLGHCGLQSPVDLDGSFWDPVDLVGVGGQPIDPDTDPEMINATGGVVIVIADEAFFRTESGSVVTFIRHDGEKDFPPCM
jgi:hypothetical protein